jgi:L-2-hydroxyglutarate oxidase LhgO
VARGDADPDHGGVDVAVIGGGVIGCAVAAAVSRAGQRVLVLEAADRLATGITSRNSGVIHSGLYYPTGSLKATSCVRGNRLLYQWAAEHGVWHQKLGKLVVAQRPDQIGDLEALLVNAHANQAVGVQLITGAEVAALEPAITASAALLCRETGIIDQAELVQSLVAAAESHGALFVRGARVTGIDAGPCGADHRLQTTRGEIRAARVVNAAGLASDEIAAMAGISRYVIHPCRGDYFRLRPAPGITYRHLIYPLIDRRHPGLGIHLTLDRAGGCRLGPDTTYVDRRDDFGPPAQADDKIAAFLDAAQRLLGPLRAEQLSYEGCGIRPKLRARHEAFEKDFVVIEEPPGFVHLIGIESPGLTAALDLADRVATAIA